MDIIITSIFWGFSRNKRNLYVLYEEKVQSTEYIYMKECINVGYKYEEVRRRYLRAS